MATFTTQPFHELLDSDKTTPSTVLDSDGKLKQSLHNVLKSTDISDNDYWVGENGVTAVEDGTSPSGKAAYKVSESASTTHQRITQTVTNTQVLANRYYKFSVDFKPSGDDGVSVRIYQASNQPLFAFDAVNMTATEIETSGQTIGNTASGFITELANGWYRADVYFRTTAATCQVNLFPKLKTAFATEAGNTSNYAHFSRPRLYEASVHLPVERVENGTFDSDITGWTDTSDSGGAISWNSSGYMDVVYTTAIARATQNVYFVNGETYRISFNNIAVSGSCVLDINSGAKILDLDDLGTGTHVALYTHTGATGNKGVQFKSFSTGTLTVDNISITKVINDGIQNDLDGEDFIETSGSAIYHGGLEYNADGSFRGIQSFEARTNLALRSNTIGTGVWSTTWGNGVTATLNSIVSPSGQLDATKLDTTDGGGDGSQSTISGLTIDNYYTVSVFVKNDDANRSDVIFYNNSANESVAITWSGSDISSISVVGSNTSNARYEDYGNDWYRLSFTVQVKATSGSFVLMPENDGSNANGSAYFWGAQFEAGKSVSPYIPTTSSSTRNRGGDKLHKPLSEFGYNHDEVTVKVEFESAGTDGDDYPRAFQLGAIDDTNNTERHDVYYDRIAGELVAANRVNGDNTSYLQLGTGPTNQLVKVMAAFKKDDFAASDDGDTVVTDTSGDMATVDTLFLGNQRINDSLLNGYIKKLIIWPKRLANATLEAESE